MKELSKSHLVISTQTTDWYEARNKCAEKFDGRGDLFFLYPNEDIQGLYNKLQEIDVYVKINTSYSIGARRLNWVWTGR